MMAAIFSYPKIEGIILGLRAKTSGVILEAFPVYRPEADRGRNKLIEFKLASVKAVVGGVKDVRLEIFSVHLSHLSAE